ncbi:SCP2 sterol-binding domain-containing protein [Pseudovibrio sp. POLY-S9]|nr:SCP2 sterol-binding domain-containing protein [Pseudovibrio sp. POLY-S9]
MEQDCDVGAFMWDFHRTLATDAMPGGETVIHVHIIDQSRLGSWWILANGKTVDLCTDDPGHDVDVYISARLECLVSIWMRDISINKAKANNDLYLEGSRELVQSAQDWFACSPYSKIKPAPNI